MRKADGIGGVVAEKDRTGLVGYWTEKTGRD